MAYLDKQLDKEPVYNVGGPMPIVNPDVDKPHLDPNVGPTTTTTSLPQLSESGPQIMESGPMPSVDKQMDKEEKYQLMEGPSGYGPAPSGGSAGLKKNVEPVGGIVAMDPNKLMDTPDLQEGPTITPPPVVPDGTDGTGIKELEESTGDDSAFLSDEEKEKQRRENLAAQSEAQQKLVTDPMGQLQASGLINQYQGHDIYQKNPDGSIKTDLEGNPLVRPEFMADPVNMGATTVGTVDPISGETIGNVEAQQSEATLAELTQAEMAADAAVTQAQSGNVGGTHTIGSVQEAQAIMAQLSQGTALTVEETALMEAAKDVIVKDYETSLIPVDEINNTLESIKNEKPMEAASVAEKLNGLLGEMEQGKVPMWARPAVAQTEQALKARGISASSIGRDSLFNAIINAAMPIAQADAQFEQQANQNNYNAKVNAILQDSSQEFAARQFNASSENQKNQFMTQLKAQVDMQNAARHDAMSQFNANAKNQMAQFNVQQQNAMEMLNTQEANTTARQNAQLGTQVSMQNQQVDLQRQQFNAGQANQMSMAQAQLDTQTNLANAEAQNRAELQKQQLATQLSLANADSANRTALANAQLQTQVDQANADRLTNADLQNAGMDAQIAQANMQMAGQLAMHQASLDAQREQFNAQNANVIAQANVQWRRQLNTAETAAINQVNAANVANAFNLSAMAQNNLWQHARDEAQWAEQANENELTRRHETAIRIMQWEHDAAMAEGAAEGGKSSAWDATRDKLINKGTDALINWLFS